MAIASSTDSQFFPSNFDVFPCDFILSQIKKHYLKKQNQTNKQ